MLRNRRLWVSVIGALMIVLVNLVPAFEPNVELLTSAFLVIVSVLVGGFTLEDVNLPEQIKVQKFSK